jgi:hypothetical protein
VTRGVPPRRPFPGGALNPVVRSILAVIVGMLVAFVLIALIEAIGVRLYPSAARLDRTDQESLKRLVASMPLAAKLCMLVAYAAGSVAGGWVAARLAPRARMMHAMIVAALLFGAGLMNLMTIPHPAWFWVASSLIYWAGAWSGAQAAGAGAEPRTAEAA